MKIELDIIKEAVALIEQHSKDVAVIKEQCNLIIKSAKEIKSQTQ